MTSRRPWWGSAYLRFVQPLHDRGRIPWCWDCRLLRQARRTPEDGPYDHDLPRWRFDEIMDTAEPATIVTAPPPGQTWSWDSAHGGRRTS